MRVFAIAICLFAAGLPRLMAQSTDRGLVLNTERAFDGYTLFAPLGGHESLLINMEGKVVHSWKSANEPANSVFLLPGGDLLRAAKVDENSRFGIQGPSGGRVERFSWEGEQTWDFVYSSEKYHQHHDIEPLPNGNVLIIAWDYISREDAIAAGRRPEAMSQDGIWPDKIVEVKQTGPTTGEVVWQWRSWDHLVQDFDSTRRNFGDVAAHPELIDVNILSRPRTDWMHTNGIAYNADLDQIVISLRAFGEIYVIDHSTTTEEAASGEGGRSGMGGDILYRWGNPANYQAGTEAERQLFGQHDARWIAAGRPGSGNITIFNNGSGRPGGDYSSVDELVPPVEKNGTYMLKPGEAFGPSRPLWSYTAPNKSDFYSSFISGAERLPNGNTLICAGAIGEFFEVDRENEVVWRYHNPYSSRREDAAKGSAPRSEAPPPADRGAGPRRGGANRGPVRTGAGQGGRGRRRQANRGGSPQNPYIVFRVIRYPSDYPGLSKLLQ